MVKFSKLLDQKTEERTYLVSSSGRQNNAKVKITPALKNVTGIEVVHARIPHSLYTIEEDFNGLSIIFPQQVSVLLLTIPVGDYTGEGLRDAIMSQTVGNLRQGTRGEWYRRKPPYENLQKADVTMTYDATRNKFRFESSKEFTISKDSTCLAKLGLQSVNTASQQI